MAAPPTILAYFDDTRLLNSASVLLHHIQADDGRDALILDSTIFHPQGGGQPSDTGAISSADDGGFKFLVQDVRSKDGVVFHYGVFEPSGVSEVDIGKEVCLYVDSERRNLNARLHSAGHLLDVCMHNVGLNHLEPIKGYHFPDGPFVEYKGLIPQNELKAKQRELDREASALISVGGKVTAAIYSYEEASKLCDGALPDYIPKGSMPRIVTLGNHLGCPCGGTHVSDIAEIISVKVTQIRMKKGVTKVSYVIES